MSQPTLFLLSFIITLITATVLYLLDYTLASLIIIFLGITDLVLLRIFGDKFFPPKEKGK